MRRRRAGVRLSLQYDKLWVEDAVYCYNEEEERVELLELPDIQHHHQVRARNRVKRIFSCVNR